MPSSSAPSRRILRRAIRTRCQAVEADEFRLLGQRVLDLSPFGMMVAADDGASVGDDVLVSFEAPSGEWFDAEAKVARVVEGWRPGDPGYCLGLRFTKIDLATRMSLGEELVGWPPPVPTRALRELS